MDIILYTNSSDPRKLNKTLTELTTISVRLKDDTNIMHPVIELDSAYLPPSANYCYIEKFKRYYFINQQGIAVGRDLMLTLEIDVLMSWKSQINDSNVVAVRSTNRGHKMLPDNIPIQAKRNIIYKQFSGGNSAFGSDKVTAETRCFLLTVLNGGV